MASPTTADAARRNPQLVEQLCVHARSTRCYWAGPVQVTRSRFQVVSPVHVHPRAGQLELKQGARRKSVNEISPWPDSLAWPLLAPLDPAGSDRMAPGDSSTRQAEDEMKSRGLRTCTTYATQSTLPIPEPCTRPLSGCVGHGAVMQRRPWLVQIPPVPQATRQVIQCELTQEEMMDPPSMSCLQNRDTTYLDPPGRPSSRFVWFMHGSCTGRLLHRPLPVFFFFFLFLVFFFFFPLQAACPKERSCRHAFGCLSRPATSAAAGVHT